MIRILVVDDSETEAALISAIIESEPDMSVIGIARNGKEAIELTARLKPDLITMDIEMPIMNGLEATRRIVSEHPTPIVVISSTISNESVQATFHILEAGALSALAKPSNIFSESSKTEREHIVNTLRSMAEITVAKRKLKFSILPKEINQKSLAITKNIANYEVIAIGVSVGGPQALKIILSELPQNFPLPILIVQHMSYGFINGYAEWLNNHTKLLIKNAVHLESIQHGTVYIAPDNCHMQIERIHGKLHIKLVEGRPVDGFYPSITMLLNSVAKISGYRAIGCLLTGMGSDGAQGLLELKKAHGHTIIQDKESCVVFGMAGVAESLGAVDVVVKLSSIANYLKELTRGL